ncbi:MAG TPA: FecR family protein, partial [Elusimicrobiota bacterium]|nr:FecR family protein [Elusimicrobiota bacterium]
MDDSTSLREGDSLRTGPKGKAELRMSEGHRLSVREKTTVTVVSGGKGLQYQFRVISGRVRAFVRKLAAKSRFEIRTPLAVAAVRGTEFEMEVLDRGTSRLSVIEGVVSFKDLDGLFNEVSVVKGQCVTIEPNQAPKPPEP